MDRRWILTGSILAAVVGAASGLASALFLIVLAFATDTQSRYPWLLYLLPLAGALIAWSYQGFGKNAAGGNNLILDQIHSADKANRVPFRMSPLVLVSTILTHLFGGSAGREGTAVQMGGAIASGLARVLKLTPAHLRIMLMAGISGGFSSVFGTPLAGTVFGMEMLAIDARPGRLNITGMPPCGQEDHPWPERTTSPPSARSICVMRSARAAAPSADSVSGASRTSWRR